MPDSFAAQLGSPNVAKPVGSPFANGADPYQTPANRRNGGPGVSAWSEGRTCHFEISRKKNDLLFIFTQKPEYYKLWRDRMIDQCCRSTMLWRHLLEFVQRGPEGFVADRAWLQNSNIDGMNAWDISTMLEAFIVDWFPKGMYNRRVQLAGAEHGNGFEVWHRLYVEFQRGPDAIEYGGVLRLQEFPRYTSTSLAKLADHIDDWMEVLATYGHELEHCPKMLRSMILKMLPKTMGEEILDRGSKPDVRSYLDIVSWVKRKTSLSRMKELSEYARKPPGHAAHLKELRDAESDARLAQARFRDRLDYGDNIEAPQIPMYPSAEVAASLGVPYVPPPPAVEAGWSRLKALEDKINAIAKPKAKPRGTPSKSPAPRFAFKGCWHCGSEDHARSGGRDGKGKKCNEFARLMSEANKGIADRKEWKLPTGYKGAYEKTKQKAGSPVDSL